MGGSFSSADNTQIANSNLVQTYAGTCDITCNNVLNDVTINTINSKVGGIKVSQTCAVNGQCSFNVSQDALTDTLFKTNQSVPAGSAGILQVDVSKTKSYQEINQYINQQVIQKCSIKAINKMNDVQIYTQNSTITGEIEIDQNATANGTCAMATIMDASALASGTSNQCASAGKKAKKSCGGKAGKSIGSILLYGGLALVIFVIIMVVYRHFFAKKKKKPCTPQTPPGEECEPPKKVPLGPMNAYAPEYGPEYDPAYAPQYGPEYPEYGQDYIPPPAEIPSYDDLPEYGQGYEEEGLGMSPAEVPREFTPQYLEAIGESPN